MPSYIYVRVAFTVFQPLINISGNLRRLGTTSPAVFSLIS